MTEDEAKTKVCCGPEGCGERAEFGTLTTLSSAGKAEVIHTGTRFCIASACMAWRWATVPNPDWKPQNAMTYPAPNPYSQPPSGIPSKTHGGCGLAGSPQ